MPDTDRIPPKADALVCEVSRIISHSPGDRSVLRHSLGRSPKDAALGVHRIVVPFLPDNPADAQERAYYAVAALIASQDRQARDQPAATAEPTTTADSLKPADPQPPGTTRPRRRNLGYSLARAAQKADQKEGGNLESRLGLLARQDVDGLYRHLPRLILQLRGDQVQIDWGVLIRDLTRWDHDPRQVAKEWTQDFYRTRERLTAEANRNNQHEEHAQ